MRESCLRWVGHVQRRAINAPIKKNEFIQVERMENGRGRPKRTLVEIIIKKDMSIMTSDKIE